MPSEYKGLKITPEEIESDLFEGMKFGALA
jgi:hypothetical protein